MLLIDDKPPLFYHHLFVILYNSSRPLTIRVFLPMSPQSIFQLDVCLSCGLVAIYPLVGSEKAFIVMATASRLPSMRQV